MDGCPNCGGFSGFHYDLVLRTHRRGDWLEDNDEEVDAAVVKYPKTVTCYDCQKRITWDLAHDGNL